MTAQRVSGLRATVTDFWPRDAGGAIPSVSVRVDRSGHWTVVEVEGEMDVQFPPLVADLVDGAASRVVFDLRGVTFMDAGGLGTLMETQRSALAGGGCVRLVAPSSSARRLLELTDCDRHFQTFDSLDQALSTGLA